MRDWLVLAAGFGIPLAAYLAVTLHPPQQAGSFFAGLGHQLMLLTGCAVGGLIGLAGVAMRCPCSLWIPAFALVLFRSWHLEFPEPPKPPPTRWGHSSVTSLAPMSGNRVAICGPNWEWAILDVASGKAEPQANASNELCYGDWRTGDGPGRFSQGQDNLIWLDGAARVEIPIPPLSGILDAVRMDDGRVRVLISAEDQRTALLLESGSPYRVVYKHSDAVFPVYAGAVFRDGRSMVYRGDRQVTWLDARGTVLSSQRLPCFNFLIAHHAGNLYGYSQCDTHSSLWRFDPAGTVAISAPVSGPGYAPLDAGEAGLLLLGNTGVHRIRPANRAEDSQSSLARLEDPVVWRGWDGGALLVLSKGRPRRVFLDGTVDSAFPWPEFETTWDGRVTVR